MKLYTKERREKRDGFYHTKHWVKIRKIQLRKSGLCEACLKKPQKKLTQATVCDHLDPSWETWAEFCAGPFQSLCYDCHKEKTYFDLRKLRKAEKTKLEIIDV